MYTYFKLGFGSFFVTFTFKGVDRIYINLFLNTDKYNSPSVTTTWEDPRKSKNQKFTHFVKSDNLSFGYIEFHSHVYQIYRHPGSTILA
ncbi:unnamed protein product [Trichobilharzia regenti]|nr:unnamed protein product [Trichobilharzia regenti]